MCKKKKVLAVFGTRPEAIKMIPLVIELNKRDGFQLVICVTGQHREMLDQVLKIFHITPDYDLNIMKQGQDLYDVTARVLMGMRGILKKELPDVVLVHGDTTTSVAAALAAAIDTAKIAFAPKFDLSAVPSASIIALSTAYVSEASNPMIASLIFVLIFSTAFVTPFPKYLSLSPSLNSSASNSPVDAPLGAVPLATVPSTNVISASTVGFPLESRISLPTTFSISK